MADELGNELVHLLPRLRRLAIGLARTMDVAEDLVQSTCERVLASPLPDGGVNLEAWAVRILRNLWFDRLRRRQVRGIEVDADHPSLGSLVASDEVGAIEQRDLFRRTAAAMDDLPEEQREVVMLVCVDDMSYAQAAEVLGCPVGTVMSRLARARRRLADATRSAGD